jgi:hypothetical protein
MSHDDNSIAFALWLAAGGAAGYAAGRYVVAPRLAKRPRAAAVVSSLPLPKARALGAGPSGPAIPIDPYGRPAHAVDVQHAGPSGDMRPRDPYADVAPSASSPPPPPITPASSPSSPANPFTLPSWPPTIGPITRPAQVDAASASGPITTPSQVDATNPSGPVTTPSQVDATNPSGPITRPSQIDAMTRPSTADAPASVSPAGVSVKRRPGAAFATSERVRAFDPIFERYRGGVPIEYVRALVEHESEGIPTARNGSSIGLMQIVPAVLADYNKRHGTAYTSEHLTDPSTSVAIGCELLALIIDSYQRNHPKLRSLQVDWSNPRFVELLTFGWNAGFSEVGGVGRVASFLELLSAVDTNIVQISNFAEHAGASKHLSNPAKVAWCKGVAALYQRERALAGHRVVSS